VTGTFVRTRSFNPLLPKKPTNQPIRWRTGPAAGTVGVPVVDKSVSPSPDEGEHSACVNDYTKDPRGRKPKSVLAVQTLARSVSRGIRDVQAQRAYPNAGRLNACLGSFWGESNSGWGAALDMGALAHGPVGCGYFTQASRVIMPGFSQGIDSFLALHACTDLTQDDIEDGGDAKLACAIDEFWSLFPALSGLVILNEDPIVFCDANVKGVVKEKSKQFDRLVLPNFCENIRNDRSWAGETAAGLKHAARRWAPKPGKARRVALPFYREASSLVWIISKLLREIGLDPIHEVTGTSTGDMAAIGNCQLVIGFRDSLEGPVPHLTSGYAGLLNRWFGIPIESACFASPSATDASLRAIAAHFGPHVIAKAEDVIYANNERLRHVIAYHRPRLEGRLAVHFTPLTREQQEPYLLLGMRLGDAAGWTAASGVQRTPRITCDPEAPSDKAVDSYIREAKPDLVFHPQRSAEEWRKRGQNALPFMPLFDRKTNAYWGYDGFALFASALDRAINTPWRKLLKPPWR